MTDRRQLLVLGSPRWRRLVERTTALRVADHPSPALDIVDEPDITPLTVFALIDPALPDDDPAVQHALRHLRDHPEIPIVRAAVATPKALRAVTRPAWMAASRFQMELLLGDRMDALRTGGFDPRKVWVPGWNYRNVDDLAEGAGMSRRSLYRLFERLGFKPPREVLRVARVSRSLFGAGCRQTTLRDVAVCAGFHEYGRFQRIVKRITGATPQQLRSEAYDEYQLAGRLAHALLRRNGNGNGKK